MASFLGLQAKARELQPGLAEPGAPQEAGDAGWSPSREGLCPASLGDEISLAPRNKQVTGERGAGVTSLRTGLGAGRLAEE